MCKALDYTNGLFNTANNIKLEWDNLHSKLSIADKKRSDVEHFIEISNNLNAAQGYKAYKLLKEVLEERRDVKNEIEELRPALELVNKLSLTNPNKKESVVARITKRRDKNTSDTESKKYSVRVLTEIFGDVIQ